jgi:hypothetical protein
MGLGKNHAIRYVVVDGKLTEKTVEFQEHKTRIHIKREVNR